MSTRWKPLLAAAARAEIEANGPDATPAERRLAAREFQAIAARLATDDVGLERAGRELAVPAISAQRPVLARLLVAVPQPRAASALLAAFAAPSQIPPDGSVLAYLGMAAPLPAEVWAYFPRARQPERISLAHALLRRSSEQGVALLEQLIADQDLFAAHALASAGNWYDKQKLRHLTEGPRLVAPDMPDWLTWDVRVQAAFRLALRGERDGIEKLERWAEGHDDGDVANAVLALGQLGWPGGVAAIARALISDDGHVVGYALDAGAALRAAALIEPLLWLASRPDEPQAPEGGSLREGALGLACGIAGSEREPAACRQAAARLDPALRYADGVPLTLAQHAANLESRRQARLHSAYNLRSMTGEDHGYDPELDFIANLAAIEAWRERARGASPAPPGGWAWQGQPLALT